MCVCVYSGEDKRTNIDDIFFAFSFASHCYNSSHQYRPNSNSYRIENDKANAGTYHWRCHCSGQSKFWVAKERARKRERTKQEDSSCFAFLKAIILLIIWHVDIRTHTQTGVSISVVDVWRKQVALFCSPSVNTKRNKTRWNRMAYIRKTRCQKSKIKTQRWRRYLISPQINSPSDLGFFFLSLSLF